MSACAVLLSPLFVFRICCETVALLLPSQPVRSVLKLGFVGKSAPDTPPTRPAPTSHNVGGAGPAQRRGTRKPSSQLGRSGPRFSGGNGRKWRFESTYSCPLHTESSYRTFQLFTFYWRAGMRPRWREAPGFDHINRNAPVLVRSPKLTRFEPA